VARQRGWAWRCAYLCVVDDDMSWSFLFAPVALGVLMLAAFAFVWHNLVRRGAWPERWW